MLTPDDLSRLAGRLPVCVVGAAVVDVIADAGRCRIAAATSNCISRA